MSAEPLQALRAGGKAALARALARVEAFPAGEESLALLDAAWMNPRGHVVGLTGPPGVGKSTLVSALVRAWRARRRTVGVIAVDPSSRRTGGALLGDRTRIEADPDDPGVFVRSMAARDRLGGLADLCAAAAVLMQAVFDVVLIETVGVGQSETEIADLAETVVLAVQPGSGDSLQFMKAGIVEVPDVAVVTKADLGDVAQRARRDLEAALRFAPGADPRSRPVLMVSAPTGQGIEAVIDALEAHRRKPSSRDRCRKGQLWLERAIRDEYGRRGLERAQPFLAGDEARSPFRKLAALAARLDGPG